MEWIILYQNQYDRVVFLSSLNTDEKDSMPYYKFLEFVNYTFKIKDFIEFRNQLDRFKVILLLKDGTWQIQESVTKEASFEEMLELNKVEEDKSDFEKRVDKSKNFLNNIFYNTRRKL
jgi:hypothetical protein